MRERQARIRQALQRRKVKKVLWLVVSIILISVYLGVNTMYTTFVFQYEQNFQEDINAID